MADYDNYTNGAKSRFGFRFKSWETPNDARPDPWASSDLFTKTDPHRDHVCRPVIIGSDGRAMPGVVDCPTNHQQKETMTTVEDSAYRVQPVSPRTKAYVPGDRKMGFPGGMFQRPRTGYGAPEPALITDGGWARPSPTGWKLPPEEPLGKVTNDIATAAEYIRGPVGPTQDSGWARPGTNGRPEGRLGKVTNDTGTVAEYVRGPMGPAPKTSGARWGLTGLYSEYGGKKVSGTIDSKEAVRRYGGQYI